MLKYTINDQEITNYAVNGNTVTIEEIVAGDQISIKYDVKTSSEFNDDELVSNTITVSDDNDSDMSGDFTEDVEKDGSFIDMSLKETGIKTIIPFLMVLIVLVAALLTKRLVNLNNI